MRKIIIAAVLYFALPFYGWAESLVFVTAEWPPYIMVKDGQPAGIHVDINKAVCKRMGIDVKIQVFPWKRSLKIVQTGKAAAIFSPKYVEERTQFLEYSKEPSDIESAVIMAFKKDAIKIKKLSDLDGKPVGIVRGYSYSQKFDNYKGYLPVITDNDHNLIKMMANKRINIVVGDESVLLYIAKTLKQDIETIYVLSEAYNYTAFSKKLGPKSKEMAEKFTQALRELKADGTIDKIKRKYF